MIDILRPDVAAENMMHIIKRHLNRMVDFLPEIAGVLRTRHEGDEQQRNK